MAVTQYIGARYVPLFADPLQWDNERTYEPLTIVQHQGNSYTSRQAVPTGIDITNESYWALTGNYNAQIEQYRAEVQTFDGRITANTTKNTEQDQKIAEIDSLSKKNEADITGLETTVNTHDNLIIGKMSGVRPGHCVVIGDSISRGYGLDNPATENWVAQLNANLGKVWTIHNYAVDGTGYVTGSKTFIAQLQEARADPSFNNDDVTTLFIAGGINDYASSWSLFVEAVADVRDYAVTNFKNADIIFVPMLCGTKSLYNYRPYALSLKNGILRYAYQYGHSLRRIGVVDSANTWLIGQTDYGTDSVHPNRQGQQFIAAYMQEYVCWRDVKYPYLVAKGSDLDMGDGYKIDPDLANQSLCISQNGVSQCFLFIKTTKNINPPSPGTYPKICDIPKWCVPSGTFRCFPIYPAPNNNCSAGFYDDGGSSDAFGSINLYHADSTISTDSTIRISTPPIVLA